MMIEQPTHCASRLPIIRVGTRRFCLRCLQMVKPLELVVVSPPQIVAFSAEEAAILAVACPICFRGVGVRCTGSFIGTYHIGRIRRSGDRDIHIEIRED